MRPHDLSGYRADLPTRDDPGGVGGSTVVDPDGLVELANGVLHDLHVDAREVRQRLRELTEGDDDLGPDPHARALGSVVTQTLAVYLAWSREIESLLLDFQEAMVAAAREYRLADEVSEQELRRRSTDAFVRGVDVPVDADGDGRIDRVDDRGRRAGAGHGEG